MCNMLYAMMIYETEEAFARRANGPGDPYVGAWRAYYTALVEAGAYAGGEALDVPATGTTIRQVAGKRHIQDGPYANTKEQLAGFILLDLPSLDAALDWAARCPATSAGSVEVRPVAPDVKQRITN
jgi:hypothetical protein